MTVVGQSGSGKSSFVDRYLKSLYRFILFDTAVEYEGYETFRDDLQGLYTYVDKNAGGSFKAVYQNVHDDALESFEFCCNLALAVEDVHFIVEEVDVFADNRKPLPDAFKTMLKLGRHSGVSMILISQRPALMHTLIRSQSRHFVCFQMVDRNDIEYFRPFFGDTVDEFRKMPSLHFWRWDHGKVSQGALAYKKELT